MKKALLLSISMLLLLSMVSFYPTYADDPPPTRTELNKVVRHGYMEMASAAISNCEHMTFPRDLNTAGPLHVNSDVIRLRAVFCTESNTALIDVASVWAGYQSKTQRLWGTVSARDPSGRTVRTLQFDTSNKPDVVNAALNVPLEWEAPWDGQVYQFTAEINLWMLPEQTGPGTVTVQWSWQAGRRKIFLPVIYTGGGNSGNNCGGYGIQLQSNLRSESWQFASPGITVAMMRFGHSEIVNFKWVDSYGNVVSALPGTGHVIQLTWGNHGYRDYPLQPTLTLQATKWPYEGDLPYLATPYDLTYHFNLGQAVCRVTIPMIWDP